MNLAVKSNIIFYTACVRRVVSRLSNSTKHKIINKFKVRNEMRISFLSPKIYFRIYWVAICCGSCYTIGQTPLIYLSNHVIHMSLNTVRSI